MLSKKEKVEQKMLGVWLNKINLEAFTRLCELNGTTVSLEIKAYVAQELEKNKQLLEEEDRKSS
jgi:hypothetical protein